MCKGPGIPNPTAEILHEKFGQEVRVDGHCGCPSPWEQFGGLACGRYHVDTQRGLIAIANTIQIVFEGGGSLEVKRFLDDMEQE